MRSIAVVVIAFCSTALANPPKKCTPQNHGTPTIQQPLPTSQPIYQEKPIETTPAGNPGGGSPPSGNTNTPSCAMTGELDADGYPKAGHGPGVDQPTCGWATTTMYYDGNKGACGCGTGNTPAAWQLGDGPSKFYTAAGSDALFGKGSTWLGNGCEKCYRLVAQVSFPFCTPSLPRYTN